MAEKLIAHPKLYGIARRGRSWLPPALYHRLWFYLYVGYWPDFAEPATFNEKIWWLKRHYRDPRMTTCADKLAVREYAADRCPSLRFPEVFFVTSDAARIPFDELPPQCVIKSNHATGHVIFYDQTRSSRAEITDACARWLRQPHEPAAAEWAYHDIPRHVFAEQRLGEPDGAPPPDYKFFVFNGSAAFVQVDLDRYGAHTRRLYDADWNEIAVHYKYPMGPEVPRPPDLPELRAIAERLAGDFPFVRVDLYLVDGDVFLGEMTFYPHSGVGPFWPQDFDRSLGEMLQLPAT